MIARTRQPTTDAAATMRRFAGLLLVAMAALYGVSRLLETRGYAGWGYPRAFSEAAMVGGLADWFAVTALFRHPLGIPIPHTAIIPHNKDRIGDNLATFLRDRFLVADVLGWRLRRLDIAGGTARWLTDPAEGAGGQFRARASRLVAQVLEALDPARFGGMIRSGAANLVRGTPLAPIAGQLLLAAMAEGRHKPLLDAGVRWAATALSSNDALIRQMVHERAGSILRWTGFDKTIADKLIAALENLFAEMDGDPEHPVRLRAEAELERLAHGLLGDPALQARVEAMKEALLANPAMARWLDGLWEQARGALLRIANDPERAMRGTLGDVLRQIGTTLRDDRRLARTVNNFARRALVGIAIDYGAKIVGIVSDTVRSWDERTVTAHIETAVGRDLQYIRVNGTVVGGLVGLAIHVVDVVLV